ncbi:MAG TPA: prephenate dehydrogenase/arogenate dehydrogenase family protein, partial [Gammaproteobacteria bacterium]|nr:prephenate dehydrogenase/arogenate dehydrogenase family protein [Gammaproteobacteria bacterium]
ETDPQRGVAGADMVVVAVPVGSFHAVLEAARPGLAPHAVVTDVGSVKAPVVEDAAAVLGAGGPVFVGGHPIAGTADSGVEAAVAGLFHGALCVLTPADEAPAAAQERVAALWRAVGSEVVTMTPAEHDRILAVTSHLPHMLAFSLIRTFGELGDCDRFSQFASGGFRDLTRIAGSDAVMWRDIALTNAQPLLEMIDRFEGQLNQLRRAIENGDGASLENLFREARTLRRGLPARGADAEENHDDASR